MSDHYNLQTAKRVREALLRGDTPVLMSLCVDDGDQIPKAAGLSETGVTHSPLHLKNSVYIQEAGGSAMIGKGLFHTHLVVSDIDKSERFYAGLFGMERIDFKDGTLVFLTTPGRNDLLALNPGGQWGYPGGCAKEQPREEKLAGVQGGVAHFGYMLETLEEYERVIAAVTQFGGKLVVRCDHGGIFTHTYLADPDGYVCEIQYGQ